MTTINDNYNEPNETIKDIIDNFIDNLQAAQELGQEFMYQTLMDYGNQLGEFPENLKTEENKIHGCQSTVYISAKKIDGRVFYQGFADSRLVKGQVAILLKIMDGQKSTDIINDSRQYLDNLVQSTDIIASLTPSRQNAFGSMYEHMKKLAENL